MKIFCTSLLLILVLSSCDRGYKFWDISKFTIVDTALLDKEEIKLLYSSRGPGNNKDLNYYIQVIVVSQRTGDTVNILTPIENGFRMEDKDKVFNYFDQNNIATKLIQMDPEKLNDFKTIDAITKVVPKKILKVARDPKFDNMADNHYPTVIGSIGTNSK